MAPRNAMNILISPDKFRGSLTADEATAAIRRGFEGVVPAVHCRELPVADGGEGRAKILCKAFDGHWVTADCHDPLGQPGTADYAMLPGLLAKDPAGVAVLARALDKPVAAFAGDFPDPCGTARIFDAAAALVDADNPVRGRRCAPAPRSRVRRHAARPGCGGGQRGVNFSIQRDP